MIAADFLGDPTGTGLDLPIPNGVVSSPGMTAASCGPFLAAIEALELFGVLPNAPCEVADDTVCEAGTDRLAHSRDRGRRSASVDRRAQHAVDVV